VRLKPPASLVGPLIAGFLASICCVGPLVLGVAGVGSFGLAAAIAPWRPWLLGLTGTLLAVASYFAYRPLPAVECGSDGACPPPISRRGQRISLWVVTVLTLLMVAFPQWSSLVPAAGARTASTVRGPATHLVTLDIHGMTCADCEPHLEEELDHIPGVVSAKVSYATESGVVRSSRPVDLNAVTAAVERAGYGASNVRAVSQHP